MKKVLSLALSVLVLLSVVPIGTAEAARKAPTRIINVVYDDSGSMYTLGSRIVDTWAQAKYSLEVFAAMLGETDTMNVYYMSDYWTGIGAPPRLVLNGKDGAAANVKKVHKETTHAVGTPFDSVRTAYTDLEAAKADEKWLVILTDGQLQERDGNIPDVDGFLAQKASDIKVLFLGMGSEAVGITSKESMGITYVEAKTNSEILTKIMEICTRIFNSNRLDVNVSTKKFSFDVPMGELIVFAQGANVEINGIRNSDGKLFRSSKAPVEVKYSDCDADNYSNPSVTELQGQLAIFMDDFVSGEYTVDVTGAETIEIFYKPNIEVAAYLTDANGNEVTDMSDLEAGEYTLTFGLVKAGTQERVGESKLLGNLSYEAYVTMNGTRLEGTYSSGSTLNIEEGTLEIDVTAYYLDYNSVSTHLSYGVFKNKTITFHVREDPSYVVDSDGFTNPNDYIEVEARIDGRTPTEEEWAILGIPELELVEGYRDFRIEDPIIEKTDELGIYRIYPQLPNGSPSTGTYTDWGYTLNLDQTIGNESWKGDMEGTIQMTDTRSWWERNWDLFVKLLILLAILLVLAGYLPLFKRYLPKSLKKKPYIKCIPSEPGEKRKDRNGVIEKNLLSTIIPYIPQTGSIKYVPKGVTGAPPMAVRAIKRRRMTLTNVKAFAGKEYITFDGEAIKKDCKKFDTGAAVTIRVKRGEWTYVCNPNQASK